MEGQGHEYYLKKAKLRMKIKAVLVLTCSLVPWYCLHWPVWLNGSVFVCELSGCSLIPVELSPITVEFTPKAFSVEENAFGVNYKDDCTQK